MFVLRTYFLCSFSGVFGNSVTFHDLTIRYFSVCDTVLCLTSCDYGRKQLFLIRLQWGTHPAFRQLGTAVDLLRFVLRMYALTFGFLGTEMDLLRFVPRMYALSYGCLGTEMD